MEEQDNLWLKELISSRSYLPNAIRKRIYLYHLQERPNNYLGAIKKLPQATLWCVGQGLVFKKEQYWMEEQDLWSIELISPRPHFPNAIRKRICSTCKAPTSLGQSKNYHKLHFGVSVKA
jgi:hypothetical protein